MSTTKDPDAAAGTGQSLIVSAAASAAYAGGSYLAFVVVFLYAVLFQAGVFVPRTVDGGGPASATSTAVVIDVLLLALFAGQHSVMARAAFKHQLTKVVPTHLERSTFVLATSGVLALVFWQWRPIPTVLWRVDDQAAHVAMWALFASGWTLVVAMTFAIDHGDLFGLGQVARHVRGRGDGGPGFRLPWPYRLVRHPMMLGFFPAFLATPTMTASHLLFAILGCGYILVGVRLEERDLAQTLPQYRAYAAATPRFVPRSTAMRRRGGDG